jgi:pilus assembly protein CpaC
VPATTVFGQSVGSDPPEDLGVIKAIVGDGVSVTWPEQSVRVAIADDALATVSVVSRREVVVNGLKAGRTSLFVWFAGGRRVFYRLVVSSNFDAARAALRELNPSIVLDQGADEDTVVLSGEVANESVARQARSLTEQLLPRTRGAKPEPPRIVNLLRYPSGLGTVEDRLEDAMRAIDPRIKVRRIQRGTDPDPANDSFILEGQVRDVNALVQAVVLADRQLGGTGKTVKAADADRVTFQRSTSGGSLAAGISAGGTASNGLQALQQSAPPQSGLSAQLARGLLVTSESGKVVSFLKVDSLPQVLVAIRVLEFDRTKARRMGMDLRLDTNNFAASSSTVLGSTTLSDARGALNAAASGGNVLSGSGNVVGAFVHNTLGLSASLDLMSEKQVARSVAEPNILTLSGEQASVLVGGEVPIPGTISTQVAVQSGFNFQGFGVRLDIRPTLDDKGIVTLEVAPSIVTPSQTLGNSTVPGFQIQRVETTARVAAGQSLVLGGLLTSNDSVQYRGIPGFQKLPLFRWQRKSTSNTELVFVITPRVIEQSSPAVSLPPLEFHDSPNHLGASGLDDNGVPFTFEGMGATVLGKEGFCVELKDSPDGDSAKLTDCLLPGSEVIILGTKDDWYHVRAASDQDGWVQRRWLHVAKERP